MPRVEWAPQMESYETGISHAAFYPIPGVGTVWNGLISVEEKSSTGDPDPIYIDGRLVYNKPKTFNYQAKLRAFETPSGFDACVGLRSVVPGVILANQPRTTFNFAYKTNVGSGGEKLHLIYNATASPTKVETKTLSEKSEAAVQEFQIDAVPESRYASNNFRPSSHLIVDSTKIPDYIFLAVENAIFGNEKEGVPGLPIWRTQDYIRNLVGNPLIEPLAEPI